MVCGVDGGFVVRLRYMYVVIVVGLWSVCGCGDDGGFVVLVWYVVLMVGFWCLCGMW